MKNYENPKCPICNTTLEEYEMWDAWREDRITAGANWIGTCPKCGKECRWRVRYKAVSFSELELVKDDSFYAF